MGVLLARGHDINAKDRKDLTALAHATLNNDGDMTAYLVKRGADVNIADEALRTPLHFAAQNDDIFIARTLLEAGAMVDPGDWNGNTPLFNAVFHFQGASDMIRLLRKHGASPGQENNSGMCPRTLAENIGGHDFGNLLV